MKYYAESKEMDIIILTHNNKMWYFNAPCLTLLQNFYSSQNEIFALWNFGFFGTISKKTMVVICVPNLRGIDLCVSNLRGINNSKLPKVEKQLFRRL